ncbi:hypothetical protein AAH113_23005, partial [Parabacteroides distasonis]|uniref:hypothetical protein n=1 Tax=Parabacteroides distasonis TaxID=823 RepID=UPI0039B537F3
MTSVENPCWVGCQTYIYSMPLWAQNLVVTNSAAVLFQHPDAIHLRGIDAPDAPACQPFQIEVGKSLMRAVILRAH